MTVVRLGNYRIEELRLGQCRFACTADHVPRSEHRFCGAETVDLKSFWCLDHLLRVTALRTAGGTSIAEAQQQAAE